MAIFRGIHFLLYYLGKVCHVNESGNKREVLTGMGNIQALLHHEKEDFLLVVVEGLNMNYYSIDAAGNLHEVTKVYILFTCDMCE